MRIEIDQSGHKIGDTQGPTILAFSNHTNDVIVIPATVKRECVQLLRQRYRKPTILYLRLFCAGLAILLRPHSRRLQTLVLDQEYKGYDGTIVSFLTEYLTRTDPSFHAHKVSIAHIGKKSPAHIKAITTYRALRQKHQAKKRKLRTVTLAELLDLLLK